MALDAIKIPVDAVCEVHNHLVEDHPFRSEIPDRFVFKRLDETLVSSPKRARTYDDQAMSSTEFQNPCGEEPATSTPVEDKVSTMIIFLTEESCYFHVAVFTASAKTTECFLRVAQSYEGRFTLSTLIFTKERLIEVSPESPFDYTQFYPYPDDDDMFAVMFNEDYEPHFKNASWTFRPIQGAKDYPEKKGTCEHWGLNAALLSLPPMNTIVFPFEG
jgi:hypothetical protein